MRYVALVLIMLLGMSLGVYILNDSIMSINIMKAKMEKLNRKSVL